jgi:hemerythrin superfamily protein
MDVVQIIEAEHRSIERLFERFERAVRTGDLREQAELARQIVRELSLHAAVEEEVLYPALARAGAVAERLDALEDHHAVKLALSELERMTPARGRFVAKMHVVEKSVRRHVEEEESELLPQLRQALDAEDLERLAGEFETVRRSAPTRPHPLGPDMPPANVIANAGASLLDRLRDALRDGGELLLTMARQLIERAVRAGREAADRTRQGSSELLSLARARGERAVEQARTVGAEMAAGAAEQGARVAERIEHRTAVASRDLRNGVRVAAARARRGAAKVKAQAGGKRRRSRTARRPRT